MMTLKNALLANAASCIGFGLIFICIPSTVAIFLDSQNPIPGIAILIVGVILVTNGLHLAVTALKPNPQHWLVLYFSIGDFIWVLASIYLLAFSPWVSTFKGSTATILVAILVGLLGFLQLYSLRQPSIN